MTPRRRKSSRKRMENRIRQVVGQAATVRIPNAVNQELNRTARRQIVAMMLQHRGRTAKEAAREKRRKLQVRARRALRIIRRELKQALRARF